jgi:hypothetical protein
VAARRMDAAGVEVLGDDQKGDPRHNGPFRLIIRNPAIRRRLFYQSYEDACGAAEWHQLVGRRLLAR